MIIKGIFRRYERWNPVHPTIGAFWGMGIGIGCGVGWGPGFGPEVIGYVGAGCGVGFSVGFTLAGVGVGLPMNGAFQLPFNAPGASNDVLEFSRSNVPTDMKGVTSDSLHNLGPHLSFLQKKTSIQLSNLKARNQLIKDELTNLNNRLSSQIQSTLKSIEVFKHQLRPPGQGRQD